MPWYARPHVRPLLGSAALHLLFIAIILIAAMNWRSPPPPPPLAIDGNVVRYEDLPPSVRSGRAIKEPMPAHAVPVPREPPAAKPIPIPQPQPDKAAADAALAAAALEQQQAEQKQAEQRQAEQRQAEQKAAQALAAEQLADAEAKAAAEAAADAQHKADLAAQQLAATAAQAKAEEAARQEQEKAAAALAAKQKSEREAELRRALDMEEEGEAVAQSGVVDEYRALLVQTIERNWIRPPSAKTGLACTLYVTQATGGTVIDVKLGDCNGDQAVRESVANAVYRASPLPAPRDPRAFERRLVIVFKPTE